MNEFFYNILKRFLTWFGDLYFATSPPQCRAKQIITSLKLVKRGDVICRGYSYYLDSYFIPGEYSHSGIVIDDKGTMLHSVAEGVEEIHIMDFIKDTDRFIILRFPGLNVNPFVKRGLQLFKKETEYDFTFSDPNKFYCHEFTVSCLELGGIKIWPSNKEFGVWPFNFNKKIFLAENLREIGQVVYEFNPS